MVVVMVVMTVLVLRRSARQLRRRLGHAANCQLHLYTAGLSLRDRLDRERDPRQLQGGKRLQNASCAGASANSAPSSISPAAPIAQSK